MSRLFIITALLLVPLPPLNAADRVADPGVGQPMPKTTQPASAPGEQLSALGELTTGPAMTDAAGAASGELVVSSDFLAPPPPRQGPASRPSQAVALTGFRWDRIPLYIHFGKRGADLTDGEIDFLAAHSRLIALEKGHGAAAHGSTGK
jgi:hypothetical protein